MQTRVNLVEQRINDAKELESATVTSFSVRYRPDAVLSRLYNQRAATRRFMDEMKDMYKRESGTLEKVQTSEQEIVSAIDKVIANFNTARKFVEGMASSEDELLSFGVKVKEEAVKGAGRAARENITAAVLSDLYNFVRQDHPECSDFVDRLVLGILLSEPDMLLRERAWVKSGLRECGALTRGAAGLADIRKRGATKLSNLYKPSSAYNVLVPE